MIKINHITINTRNNRVSTPSDVSKTIFLRVKSIVRDAQKTDGVELFDNTIFKLTIEADCYVGTLFIKQDKTHIPILSTSGAKTENKKRYVWNSMQELFETVYGKENTMKMIPINPPFIVDCVLPTYVLSPLVWEWAGDFTKCLGWIIMYPNEIINK